MPESIEKLTNAKIRIIQFIIFRTKSRQTFFGSNKYIANELQLKENSVKVMINQLIKDGYLVKDIRGKQRHLFYTGKPVPRCYENFANLDKHILAQDVDNYKRDAEYYQKEYNIEHAHCEKVLSDNTSLQNQVYKLQHELIVKDNLIDTLLAEITPTDNFSAMELYDENNNLIATF